ncbi:MAG: LamG domain-containing protein [Planctomycetota bacterium]
MCDKLSYSIFSVLLLGIALSCTAVAGDANLVAWWKMDDDGTGVITDFSGNNRHGTINGDPQFVPGIDGDALEFDGDGDFVVVEGYKGIFGDGTNTPPFSIAVWIRKEGPVGGDGEVIGWGSTGTGNRLEFRFNAGNSRLRIESGGGNIQGDIALTTGEWTHVVVTLDENPTYTSDEAVNFYFDGVLVNRPNADPDPIHPTEGQDVVMGQEYNQSGGRVFVGALDDVRIYDKVLAPAEIRDIIELGYLASAHSPEPADGSMHTDTWATLNWGAGGTSASHNLYFGTSLEDVSAGAQSTFVGSLTTNSQTVGFVGFPAPDGLAPGTTYYWRVDEVNDAHPDSPWEGRVWSFWVPSVTGFDPVPQDGEAFEDPEIDLSWSPGMNATLHAVYLGTDAAEVENAAGAPPTLGTTFDPGTLAADTAYYWRVDTFNGAEWIKGPVWNFSTRPEAPSIADPSLLVWYKFNEGAGTNAFDWSGHGNHGKLMGSPQRTAGYEGQGLYLGADNYVAIQNFHYDNAGDIREVTVAAWVRTNTGAPQIIASFDRNEYWRLQINGEVATPGQVGWHVWTDAEQSDYGSVGRVDDGQWHHICGVFELGLSTIYIDGEPEPSVRVGTSLGRARDIRYGYVGTGSESTSFNADPRTPEDWLQGEVDEVRIYDRALTKEEIANIMRPNPLAAWAHQPAGGVFDLDSAPTSLSWTRGDGASGHDVYFSTDLDALKGADASDTSGIYRGRQSGTTYVPPEGFDWGQTYYWRIDEFNNDGTITEGGIRVIEVTDFLVVDDFEDYNDFPPDEIWSTWIDGFETTTNGALAGHPDPIDPAGGSHYVETTIVHSRAQSMPIYYDNNLKYSEVTRTLSPAQNWTRDGVATLSLWIHGASANAQEKLYVALNGVAVEYGGDAAVLQTSDWTEWLIPLQAFADLGVNLNSITTISVGLGDKDNVVGGGSGVLYVDDIRLYRP